MVKLCVLQFSIYTFIKKYWKYKMPLQAGCNLIFTANWRNMFKHNVNKYTSSINILMVKGYLPYLQNCFVPRCGISEHSEKTILVTNQSWSPTYSIRNQWSWHHPPTSVFKISSFCSGDSFCFTHRGIFEGYDWVGLRNLKWIQCFNF